MTPRWVPAAVTLLAALTWLPAPCRAALVTGPTPLQNPPAAAVQREVPEDQRRLQEALGIWLRGGIFENEVYVAQERSLRPWQDPSMDSLPEYAHEYSLIEAGQKGVLPERRGVWAQHAGATLVLGHHAGCPVKLYRIDHGALHSEVLGNPLEQPWFRPTSVLEPRQVITFESLCEAGDPGALVSYVQIPAWKRRWGKILEPADMLTEYPQHSDLISRLAGPGLNDDLTGVEQSNYTTPVDRTGGEQSNYTIPVDRTGGEQSNYTIPVDRTGGEQVNYIMAVDFTH